MAIKTVEATPRPSTSPVFKPTTGHSPAPTTPEDRVSYKRVGHKHIQQQGGDHVEFDYYAFYQIIPILVGFIGCCLCTLRCHWIKDTYKDDDDEDAVMMYGLLPRDAQELRARGLIRERRHRRYGVNGGGRIDDSRNGVVRETDALLSDDDDEEGNGVEMTEANPIHVLKPIALRGAAPEEVAEAEGEEESKGEETDFAPHLTNRGNQGVQGLEFRVSGRRPVSESATGDKDLGKKNRHKRKPVLLQEQENLLKGDIGSGYLI